ncbi:MAG: hypothetical protein J5785_05595 [Spirochaetales bacterium]|nr:hypothetical protein [Spirochaetales bacterium]
MYLLVALNRKAVVNGNPYYYAPGDMKEYQIGDRLSRKLEADNFCEDMWHEFGGLMDIAGGDCDYFGPEKCRGLARWTEEKLRGVSDPELKDFYEVLLDYSRTAAGCGTGIDFEF